MRRRKVLEARERRRERKRLVERSVRETRMVTSYSAGELSRCVEFSSGGQHF